MDSQFPVLTEVMGIFVKKGIGEPEVFLVFKTVVLAEVVSDRLFASLGCYESVYCGGLC